MYIKLCIHTLLHCIALHCMAWHGIALHYITLHYTTLHYITLHTYIHTYIYMDRVSHIYLFILIHIIYIYICIYIMYVLFYIYMYSIPYTYVSAGPEFMLSLLSFRHPPKPPGPPERVRAQGHPGRHRSPEPHWKSCPAGSLGWAGGWGERPAKTPPERVGAAINPLNCNIRAVPRLSQRQVKASRETK